MHPHPYIHESACPSVYMEVCVYELHAGTKADDVPNKLHIIAYCIFHVCLYERFHASICNKLYWKVKANPNLCDLWSRKLSKSIIPA